MRWTDRLARGKAKVMRSIVWRAIGTVAAALVYGWLNYLLNPAATLLTGQIAGRQFDNGNVTYVGSTVRDELLRPSRPALRGSTPSSSRRSGGVRPGAACWAPHSSARC